VSGPTLLRARVEPDGAASTMVFFVDGRLICTLAVPPLAVRRFATRCSAYGGTISWLATNRATSTPTTTITPAPAPAVAPPPAVLGPAAYPPQITAGSSYAYSGSGTLIVGASDSIDTVTRVCAGINDSTQAFPAGYAGVYFVGIQFADGNRLAAGYERNAAGRLDFATIQNDRTGLKQGARAPGPTTGSHTYCVTRGMWSLAISCWNRSGDSGRPGRRARSRFTLRSCARSSGVRS